MPPSNAEVDALFDLHESRSNRAVELFEQHKQEDGTIGFRQLTAVLRAMLKEEGVKARLDFETLEAKFEEADTNGDKRVSYDEFIAWYNHTVEWARRCE